MSYRDLEIWKLAKEAAIGGHRMTLRELPKFDHLEGLFETGSLTNETTYGDLQAQLDLLGRKLNVFIDAVEREHRADVPHSASRNAQPATRIPQRATRIPHPAP